METTGEERLEPKGMLDAMTDSSAPRVLAAVGVNGPEGGLLDWDAVNWRTCQEHVRPLRRRIFTASRNPSMTPVGLA